MDLVIWTLVDIFKAYDCLWCGPVRVVRPQFALVDWLKSLMEKPGVTEFYDRPDGIVHQVEAHNCAYLLKPGWIEVRIKSIVEQVVIKCAIVISDIILEKIEFYVFCKTQFQTTGGVVVW